MKANRIYKNMDELTLMDSTFKTNKCCRINISFAVDARHIVLAIADQLGEPYQDKQVTRKSVEEYLKDQLWFYGESWYSAPIDCGEEGRFHNLNEKMERAIKIANELFTEFMDVPLSVKFIKDFI